MLIKAAMQVFKMHIIKDILFSFVIESTFSLFLLSSLTICFSWLYIEDSEEGQK